MRLDILSEKSKAVAFGLAIFCCALTTPASSTDNSTEPSRPEIPSLYIKVKLDHSVKTSKLKSGDVLAGKLALDLYSGSRRLFPAGSEAQLTVDKLARRKRVPNDHWPWLVKFFMPRHENYPTFSTATIVTPQGNQSALPVSLISMNQKIEVRAEARKAPSERQSAPAQTNSYIRSAETIVTLKGEIPKADELKKAGPEEALHPVSLGHAAEIRAGTIAKIVLLDSISASKNAPGDIVLGRFVAPVHVDGVVALPEGTLVEGRIVKRTPPRTLSRSGSMLLTFTQLKLAAGTGIPIAASVSAAELDQRSRTKIDPEGRLRGDRPGKAWMLINLGTTAGIAKVADDGTQLMVEAIVSTATDASTAGTARIVSACASGLFFLTRHGRDVVLPKFTEMNIVFDRPVDLTPLQPQKTVP